MSQAADPLLQPFTLKHLTLRNRVMSTAHEPAYSEDGMPKDRYQLYHVEKAKGGIALTMTAGSAALESGADLAVSTWDVLSGQVAPGQNVLVFDDNGADPGVQAAEFLAQAGAAVELASPAGRRGSCATRLVNFRSSGSATPSPAATSTPRSSTACGWRRMSGVHTLSSSPGLTRRSRPPARISDPGHYIFFRYQRATARYRPTARSSTITTASVSSTSSADTAATSGSVRLAT